MMSMSIIGNISNIGEIMPAPIAPSTPAPVMIEVDGALSFPGRIPAPEAIYELRQAIQTEDAERLNAILAENHLFMAPNS